QFEPPIAASRAPSFRDFLEARIEAARRAAEGRDNPVARAEARLCGELLVCLSDAAAPAPHPEDTLETARTCQSDWDGRQAGTTLLAGWRIVAGRRAELPSANPAAVSA